MEVLRPTACALLLITVLGNGPTQAQTADSPADVSAVMAANIAYYTAQSTLDMPAMEKAWAHEDYVSFSSRSAKEPTVGWVALQPYLAKNFAGLSEFSLKPVDPKVHVYGDSAWVIGREEIGAGKMKDGTPISNRTIAVTNLFEKHGGKWLMVGHHGHDIPQ